MSYKFLVSSLLITWIRFIQSINISTGINSFPNEVYTLMSDGILFDWDVTRRLCQDNQTMSGKYGAFCSYIYINLKSIKNETQLVDFLNSYCEYAMNISNEFDAGFGSLVECIRHVHSNVIRDSYAKKINRSEYNKIFHPVLKLPPSGNCSSNWMWNLQNDEFSYFSQSGQDGVLQTILLNIGMANRYYVEIGFNAREWTMGSNTYMLHSLHSWEGLLLDITHENKSMNLHRHEVTTGNILDLFSTYNVPANPDYVSIDIDSQDIWIAKEILSSHKYRPRVMSVEFNSQLPIGCTLAMPPGYHWNQFDIFYGAAAGAIKVMANSLGYEVVHIVGFFDMYLVQRDLLQGQCPPPFASFARNTAFLHTCVTDPTRMGKWVEYISYVETGDVELAQRNAIDQVLLMQWPTTGTPGSPSCLGLMS